MPLAPTKSRLVGLKDVPQRAAQGTLRVLLGLIHRYQRWLSPMLGNQCRFHPTCSCYAEQALTEHGIARGLGLTVWRLLRCQPLAKGGFDPVPEPSHGHHHSTPADESDFHATH